MRSARPVLGVLSSALIALLASCGATRLYDGPARPGDEVATVVSVRPRDAEGLPGDTTVEVRLVALDGRPVGDVGTLVEILPGRHELRFAWRRLRFVNPFDFEGDDSTHLAREIGRGEQTVTLRARPGVRHHLAVPDDPARRPIRLRAR